MWCPWTSSRGGSEPTVDGEARASQLLIVRYGRREMNRRRNCGAKSNRDVKIQIMLHLSIH